MDSFDRIYDLYRDEFLRSASYKFNKVPLEDLVDSWQDSVISFFEQIRSGRITNLSCSIKTFLFLIGYRYIIKYKRHYLKEFPSEPMGEEWNSQLSVLEAAWGGPVDDDSVMLMKAVEQLPVQSRRLLVMRYMEGKSIDEIMKEMNYNSGNAVSVTLSRSLKKLKEMLEPFMNKS
ncbi:MAG: sigma-70 family RNA polymerase sigma factor [Saprospiraceae bacterium]